MSLTDDMSNSLLSEETGAFDIIGDVHGCAHELTALLTELGYAVVGEKTVISVTPPTGRRAIFVGDLVDRGPRSPDVLRLALRMTETGNALAVIGNHDDKLRRYLHGRDVKITHGLGETIEQLACEP